MKYGVVIYNNMDFRDKAGDKEKRAIVFYDDDISELEFLVRSHMQAFNMDTEKFSGGLVFEKVEPSVIIGVITSDGVYCPREILESN